MFLEWRINLMPADSSRLSNRVLWWDSIQVLWVNIVSWDRLGFTGELENRHGQKSSRMRKIIMYNFLKEIMLIHVSYSAVWEQDLFHGVWTCSMRIHDLINSIFHNFQIKIFHHSDLILKSYIIKFSLWVCVCVCVCMSVRNRLPNHACYSDEAFAGDAMGIG